jgi:hypothetical protein
MKSIKLIALAYAALVGAAIAQPLDTTIYVVPRLVSEEAKILALKLGYQLNGNSMVRWGSIDLTDPAIVGEPSMVGPPAPEPKKGRGR